MKTTKTITVTEILCDQCGGPVVYSGSFCIVCGKHFCQKCDVLVFHDFKTPSYFNLVGHGSAASPHVRSCPKCKNKITKGMKKLKEITAQWENDREYYNERYNKLATQIFAWVERREREIEKETN